MRKIFILLAAIALVVTGCSKEDEAKFDYDMEILYGKWRVTHVEREDGSYLDVTTPIAEDHFEPTYMDFRRDGSYYGSGFFGNGAGTYTAVGKKITTYVDGKLYLRYDVLSLTNTNAEVEMYEEEGGTNIKLKVKKQ